LSKSLCQPKKIFLLEAFSIEGPFYHLLFLFRVFTKKKTPFAVSPLQGFFRARAFTGKPSILVFLSKGPIYMYINHYQ